MAPLIFYLETQHEQELNGIEQNKKVFGKYLLKVETTIPVLSSEKKGKTHRGNFWVSHSPQKKLAVFYYDPCRSSSFPNEYLKEYQGFLQTDGYWRV